jgi:hypothetical protein
MFLTRSGSAIRRTRLVPTTGPGVCGVVVGRERRKERPMRPHARPSAYRAVLGNRPFVALWLGQAISRFGDALYDLALL